MLENNRRSFIQLIYSSTQEVDKRCRSELEMSNREWGQFELFAPEKPDVMIFAQPDRLGFEGIVKIVALGHARRIFDLREVPFISFGNETRESFLRVLRNSRVEYFNIFKLRQELGRTENHVGATDGKYFSFDHNEVMRTLKPMIESGPTVVFSDSAPKDDKVINGLLDLLSQAKISYTPVYAQ